MFQQVFQRFTERARHAVVFAGEEARSMGHEDIDSEHMLLGLLREQEGLAARVLESLDITLGDVRARIALVVHPVEAIGPGQIPFSPRAKRILELALREAHSLGDTTIGTEHILLGLVREDSGVAARVLQELDADVGKIQDGVIRMRSGPSAPASGWLGPNPPS